MVSLSGQNPTSPTACYSHVHTYGEIEYTVAIMLSYESSVLSCAICLLSSAAVQTEIGLHLYVVSPLHVTNARGKKWL